VPLLSGVGRVGELVALARSRGTQVVTIGNTDDCVFSPFRCLEGGARGRGPLPRGLWLDNVSSQIVETAVSRLVSLGTPCLVRNFFAGAGVCIGPSHSAVLSSPEVLGILNGYIESSVVH